MSATRSANLQGLRVAAMESRRGDDMVRMIERLGGTAFVSPSMREVPLGENRAVIQWAHRLMSGEIDLLLLMTGVGVRQLLAQLDRHVDRERFLGALSDVKSIARGPKPKAVLRELGITPTYLVPEPNTWRELLQLIDEQVPVSGLTVGIQEYGESNPSLIAGLEARGATIDVVRVYSWGLPEDTGPLEENVRRICRGEIDVLMFTSANQVANLLKVAQQMGLEGPLRDALRKTVVASIGPTTSERLQQSRIAVDIEPENNKMGHLVQAVGERASALLERKRQLVTLLQRDPDPAAAASQQAPWHDSLFLRACRSEPVERTPIWLMRQAGRYMEEYRQVRSQMSFLELCKNPPLCSEVMCTAVDRLKVDAAIIFSDLLPILEPMGMELEFAKGEGPVIHNPVREATDVDRVVELESVDALHFVVETVARTRADLPPETPLIGFGGAPFTLASYAIEGGASRNYLHTKTLMYRDPGAWQALMERFARAVTIYLNAQIAAGAQAVQLFDSWAGCLSPGDYDRFVAPHVRTIVEGVTESVPVISFATGNPALLPSLASSGAAVIGVDWRIRLDEAWERIGHDRAIQGNLDPAVLLADRDEIRRRAKEVLDQAAGRPGHIFNLGHGVLQQTPVENAIALVAAVKELSQR